MNPSHMLFLYELSASRAQVAAGGPRSPRPQDPGPEGGEGEPAGDEDDDDDEPETRRDPSVAPREEPITLWPRLGGTPRQSS